MSRKTDATIATEPTPAPVEATPVAAKQTPAERKAARLQARDEARARGEVTYNAAGRPDFRDLPCLCGCEAKTHRDEAAFLSGHDARLRGAVIRAEAEGGNEAAIRAIPAHALPFFLLGAPIAGLLLEEHVIRDVKLGGF